jgi:hypothetical protein
MSRTTEEMHVEVEVHSIQTEPTIQPVNSIDSNIAHNNIEKHKFSNENNKLKRQPPATSLTSIPGFEIPYDAVQLNNPPPRCVIVSNEAIQSTRHVNLRVAPPIPCVRDSQHNKENEFVSAAKSNVSIM